MPENHWEAIGNKKRAGVLAPLFSVYSKNSAGIGDFSDLKLLVDWCNKSGLTILQLLPMNEVGSTFCPYDAISSFALEPMYISLDGIPCGPAVKKDVERLKSDFPSDGKRVDYAVKAAKMKVLSRAYGNGSLRKSDKAYGRFILENSRWLEDFALFKALKIAHDETPWYDWPEEFKLRRPEALTAFRKKNAAVIEFEKWAQYMAFTQFKDLKKYAASKGVLICGDLPILISRDSADVWSLGGYFRLDFSAGAPPDMYCAKGQRWGMPVYNMDNVEADGYSYIKAKLSYAGNFYDMIRIDHAVGLFRIWQIPYHDPVENEGLNGAFDPKDESAWEGRGKKALSAMLASTDMLFLAEDLGVIPKVCTQTLKEYAIPGNDVQRWAKDWAVKHDFLDPKDYRRMSVAMLSTHDTANWPAWWENEAGTVDGELFIRRSAGRGIDSVAAIEALFDPSRSKHGRLRWKESVSSVDVLCGVLGKRREEIADFIEMYENTYMEKEKLWAKMGLKGRMRERSDKDIVEAAFRITFRANSAFRIELLNDYLYMADLFNGDPFVFRINRPGTVSKDNWSMVIPLSLEDLLKNNICRKIKSMTAEMQSNNPQ